MEQSQEGISPDQVRALFDFMFEVSIRLEALESVARKNSGEQEFRAALEQARTNFPSRSLFPASDVRENLLSILHMRKEHSVHPE